MKIFKIILALVLGVGFLSAVVGFYMYNDGVIPVVQSWLTFFDLEFTDFAPYLFALFIFFLLNWFRTFFINRE